MSSPENFTTYTDTRPIKVISQLKALAKENVLDKRTTVFACTDVDQRTVFKDQFKNEGVDPRRLHVTVHRALNALLTTGRSYGKPIDIVIVNGATQSQIDQFSELANDNPDTQFHVGVITPNTTAA